MSSLSTRGISINVNNTVNGCHYKRFPGTLVVSFPERFKFVNIIMGHLGMLFGIKEVKNFKLIELKYLEAPYFQFGKQPISAVQERSTG